MDENNSAAEKFAESLRAIENVVNARMSKHSEERIAELRRRYQNGEYKPNPQDIAAKLIDEHLS